MSLCSSGLRWLDDSQIAKLMIERGYAKARPRIEIEVSESSS
jgi:Holliday junction resolvase RusA-like endonuclease